VSHRVPGLAACPWRLYYTRYYTAAAISTSQPPGTPVQQAIIRCLADALPERADAGSGEAGLSSLRTRPHARQPPPQRPLARGSNLADGLNTYTVTPSYGNCRRRALTLLACDAVALVTGATITVAFVIRAT
jgi:hypothetical protein